MKENQEKETNAEIGKTPKSEEEMKNYEGKWTSAECIPQAAPGITDDPKTGILEAAPRVIDDPKTDGLNRGKVELKIILVGSAGAGKSATGNSILRNKVFESRGSAVPVTTQCQKGEGVWGDRRLLVMDTPGILPSTVPDELSTEIKRCSQPSPPVTHAILLVLQAGRFTLEERESVQRIQRLFGKEALKFTVIVFTRKEDLESKTLGSFVHESEKKLKELIKSCGGRVCAFNNRATGAEREQQVGELIQMIDNIAKGNGNRYYRLDQSGTPPKPPMKCVLF
ncbi:GTPase IMAP family member 1-like [Lissotriton helveticus]